jgi:hypothetical protein
MPTPRLMLLSVLAFILMGGGFVWLAVSNQPLTIGGKYDDDVSTQITPTPKPTPAVLIGAGDIASCKEEGDEKTATLVEGMKGTVFTLGDAVYDKGTLEEFTNCYTPTWGRFKERTRPVSGNHEYSTLGASGYYDYFGSAAGDPSKGYYSYSQGSWKVVVLNSNCKEVGGCDETSPQYTWAAQEFKQATCVVAMMHHPRFNSGSRHGNATNLDALWKLMYQEKVELALAGHEHLYERFAPLNGEGQIDLERGVRAFTVGTGGKSLYSFAKPQPGSEVRNNTSHGVLKLILNENAYEWEFIPVLGNSFTDSGTGSCRE